MLNKLKNRKEEGFTIIEVLIVLAIAGLIILIVLLAVPALQRNGRNSTIKSDAGAIAGAVSEFASNNDGAMPTVANSSCATGSVSLNNATGTASVPKIQGNTGVNCVSSAAAVTPAVGTITVDIGYKCPAAVSGASVTPTASSRSVAIIYAIETSSTNLAKCTDS